MSGAMPASVLTKLSDEHLLNCAEDAGAGNPLVQALARRLDDLLQREKDDRDTTKEALKAALEAVVRERDEMCRWAFGAAIDRLDEGVVLLESETGPKSAAEFKERWAWRDFAVGRMRELRKQFLDGAGEAEVIAKTSIKMAMPTHSQRSAPSQKVSAKGARMSRRMEQARTLLVEARNMGKPLSGADLASKLETMGANRGTFAKMSRTLMDRGWIEANHDGLLAWTGPS